MKGLLTATPHVEDEVVVGEVLDFPVVLLDRHDWDNGGRRFYLGLALHPNSTVLTVEDDDFWSDVDLTPEQAKALHEALGVALYGC